MPCYPIIEINVPQQEDQTPGNSPTGYPVPGSRYPGSPGRTPYGSPIHPGARLSPLFTQSPSPSIHPHPASPGRTPCGSPSHPNTCLSPLLIRSPSPNLHPHPASGWPNGSMSPSQYPQRGRSNSRYTPSPPPTPEDARSCSPHVRRSPRTSRSVSSSPPASPSASARRALSADPWAAYRCDSPAPVVPPFIPGHEYDAPTPYIPVRSPANGDYVQPPPCACHPPGGYPGAPRPHASAVRGPDAELPAHADAHYQINGSTYPTSLAQQRSPWLLPYHGAPACGHHHHQPGGTNVNVSTRGDVGVVQVTVQTRP